MKQLWKPLGFIILACLIFSFAAKIIRHHNIETKGSDSSVKKDTAAAARYETESSQETPMTQEESQEIPSDLREIYYAGGCFWGVESYFSQIPGVYDVTVGYANGSTENPSYEEVCRHTTGHAETVHVRYDPELVSLKTLTEHFFKIINPLSHSSRASSAHLLLPG